ncbi:hypothetical protein PRZ48_013842 [Zasmidium cellare]|uniref:Protein kinase domain-containing protein n=1 Tax=Zasmidium cellare TaxID=395010 RepID=A0ABR0E285_ZASCE|nr:hypothetical protein PRZ48_013842 [Zasmidium cellare]
MPPIPDLVRLTRLDTQFSPRDSRTRYTQHKSTGSKPGRRHTQEVERWQRTKALGRGSYGGAVYLEKCIHGDKTGGVRAVKKIRKPFDTNYYRELEALAFFSYPKYEHYFVNSLGWYEDRSNIFIAMEYIQHRDLQQYLNAPLPQEEAKHITYQILEGLDFMHENGFAHRDLKPATGGSRSPTADFGLTKRALEDFTQLRTVAGTPAFTAPEVLGYGPVTGDANDTSYTTAVDLWSTGVIAFLIVTGDIPFKDQRQLGQYAQGLGAVPFDPLTTAQIDEHVHELIRTLMAPDPKLRPATASCLKGPWFATIAAGAANDMQTMGSEAAQASLASGMDNGNTKGSLGTNGTYEDWPHSQQYSARWTTDEQNSTVASDWSDNTADKKDSGLSGIVDLSLAPTTSSSILKNPFESEGDRTEDPPGKVPSDDEHSMSSEESYESLATVKASPSTQHVDKAVETHPQYLPLPEPRMHVGLETPKISSSRMPYDERDFAPKHRTDDGKQVGDADVHEIDRRAPDPAVIMPPTQEPAPTHTREKLNNKPSPRLVNAKQTSLQTPDTLSNDNGALLLPTSPRASANNLLSDQKFRVWCMAFAPDGRHLTLPVSNPDKGGGEVQFWDTASGTLTQSLRCDTLPTIVAFSSDGRLLAAATSRELLLWNNLSATRIMSIPFKERNLRCHCVTFSADGRFVAVGAFQYPSDNYDAPPKSLIGVWVVEDGNIVKGLIIDRNTTVFTIGAMPDGTLMAASVYEEKVSGQSRDFYSLRLWDVVTGVDVCTIRTALCPEYVTFSPDSTFIACSTSRLSTIKVWYAGSGTLLNSWRVDGPADRWFPIAFSPDSKQLVSGASKTVTLWDVPTGRQICRVADHADWIRCLAFSQDGSLVSSASADGIVQLTDLQSAAAAATPDAQQNRPAAPSTADSSSTEQSATAKRKSILTKLLGRAQK